MMNREQLIELLQSDEPMTEEAWEALDREIAKCRVKESVLKTMEDMMSENTEHLLTCTRCGGKKEICETDYCPTCDGEPWPSSAEADISSSTHEDAFIVLIEDRHFDTDVEIHRTEEGAIQQAKDIARRLANDPDNIEEQDIDGWLFYARYSLEGDYVRVQRKEIAQ